MKPVCEIVVKKVLPATRAMVAERLSKKGLTGKQIASKMSLTPAAVTHYLHKARGTEEIKNKVVLEKVDILVEKLMQDSISEKEKMKAFCVLCKVVREQGIICELHMASAGVENCCLCRD